MERQVDRAARWAHQHRLLGQASDEHTQRRLLSAAHYLGMQALVAAIVSTRANWAAASESWHVQRQVMRANVPGIMTRLARAAAGERQRAVVKRVYDVVAGATGDASPVDVNDAEWFQGGTVLHWAAWHGEESIVALLLDVAGVDVDARSQLERETPLHWAALTPHRSPGVVDLLLAAPGVDVNARNDRNETPLHLAARHGRDDVVRVLLASDRVDVNARDAHLMTALHWAVTHGSDAVVDLLLGVPDVDVNARDGRTRTPLHDAMRLGRHGVVQRLLDAPGIAVDQHGADLGTTPLHWAVAHADDRVVAALLARARGDVVVSARDRTARTPLHVAVRLRRDRVVQMLLEARRRRPALGGGGGGCLGLGGFDDDDDDDADVDVNALDDDGLAPLHWAVLDGTDAAVALLLAAPGIDVNARDGRQRATPLHYAASGGRARATRLLLAAVGVDARARTRDGSTPLHEAAAAGCPHVVRLLLLAAVARGVDVNARDDDDRRTPLHVAVQHGHADVVVVLLAAAAAPGGGVNVNARDRCGRTPLDWAAAGRRAAIVQALVLAPGIVVNAAVRTGRRRHRCCTRTSPSLEAIACCGTPRDRPGRQGSESAPRFD